MVIGSRKNSENCSCRLVRENLGTKLKKNNNICKNSKKNQTNVSPVVIETESK